MITIKIDRSTFAQLANEINKATNLRNTLWNRTPLHKRIKDAMNLGWQNNFRSEGDKYGNWPVLAPRTQEERRQGGFNPIRPKLVRTGGLKGYFAHQRENAYVNHSSTTWNFWNEEGTWMLTHQFGMSNEFITVPPRPMVGINESDEQQLEEMTREWAEQQVARIYGVS